MTNSFLTILSLGTALTSACAAAVCPAPATNAFTGCYFNNQTLSGDPVFIHTDSQINFYWGNDSPDPSVTPLNFSARWQGNFLFDAGNYTFTAITSDGMRIYLDGNLILDHWRDQPPYIYTASQTVSQGTHLVIVEYYEHLGGATAQVSWQGKALTQNAPVISSFTAAPSSTPPGQPAMLAWTVIGAATLSIDNGVGDVTSRSSVAVTPVATTTYTLTARNDAGSVTASVPVKVISYGQVPGAGGCPLPATGAFTGCYFNNTALSSDPVFVRTDREINFSWGNGSPDSTLSPMNFSARWQGYFSFDAGNYTFTAITSDGMRLYLDGNLIIDRWRDQPPYQYQAKQTVSQGTHLVVVEYYERQGGATAQVSWQGSAAVTQLPVISSFSASPSTVVPGQPVTLAWAVTGATAIAIDNGLGDVSGRASVAVFPAQTTVYTVTAHNSAGDSTATVTLTAGPVTMQPLPSPPVLISATAAATTEVDLVWAASTGNVAGYQIVRNGSVLANVAAPTSTYADTTVSAGSNYTYALKTYDAAQHYSVESNSISAITPTAGPVSVRWYGACWQNASILGVNGNFQSIDFSLKTPTPVPVQGTLFFAPNCSASQGMDNMNDLNTLTGSTQMVQGFIHFPDVTPASAVYWVGGRTADGMCPAGSPCSGCVNYTKTTPSCSALP